jgi:hypothetical protein
LTLVPLTCQPQADLKRESEHLAVAARAEAR